MNGSDLSLVLQARNEIALVIGRRGHCRAQTTVSGDKPCTSVCPASASCCQSIQTKSATSRSARAHDIRTVTCGYTSGLGDHWALRIVTHFPCLLVSRCFTTQYEKLTYSLTIMPELRSGPKRRERSGLLHKGRRYIPHYTATISQSEIYKSLTYTVLCHRSLC